MNDYEKKCLYFIVILSILGNILFFLYAFNEYCTLSKFDKNHIFYKLNEKSEFSLLIGITFTFFLLPIIFIMLMFDFPTPKEIIKKVYFDIKKNKK